MSPQNFHLFSSFLMDFFCLMKFIIVTEMIGGDQDVVGIVKGVQFMGLQ